MIMTKTLQDPLGSDEDFTRMIIKDPLHNLVRTLIILVIMAKSLKFYIIIVKKILRRSLGPIYTVRLCCTRQAYDRPMT